jgi:hypothetical protein
MKNYLIHIFTVVLIFMSYTSFSQRDYRDIDNNNVRHRVFMPKKGFKKENLFIGGDVTASFFNGSTVLGASPMVGYRVNNYLDAGLVANFLYTGERDYKENNDRLRQYVYGPGTFARIYPVPFLFVQAQLEQNYTTEKYKAASGSEYYSSSTSSVSAPSLLLGGGYASGRVKGSNTFFYFSVLFDVLKNRNSPYVSVKNYGTSNERVDIVPLIRAGVNIGLFQGRKDSHHF